MLVKINRHVKHLSASSLFVKRQFFPSDKEACHSCNSFVDPLLEDKNRRMKGLVYKYRGRVLVELTLNCASYCRFCTRRRRVSDVKRGLLTNEDLDNIISFVLSKKEINEVIFSGGDPLTVPKLLVSALSKFSKLPQIKIIRVHTRVPVSQPSFVKKEILDAFSLVGKAKAFYLSIHFEHPDELTPQTIGAVKKIRATGAVLLSQSVFLKGINDSYSVLENLFSSLVELGIRPYYIYHCDLVKGIEHFIVPIKKEIEIMTKIRKTLSGLAFPFHVIDSPNGVGKIPVPLNFWKFSTRSFVDFGSKEIKMY